MWRNVARWVRGVGGVLLCGGRDTISVKMITDADLLVFEFIFKP